MRGAATGVEWPGDPCPAWAKLVSTAGPSCRSKTTTSARARARCQAGDTPITPAPRTATLICTSPLSLLSFVVKARKNRCRSTVHVAVVGPRIGTVLRKRADDRHLVHVDAIEAVGQHLAPRPLQLRRQLDARGAGADDGQLRLFGAQWCGLRMGADAGVDHAGMEAPCVCLRLQLHRVLAHAWRAEIVALASDRDDERVIAQLAPRRDLAPFRVVRCRQRSRAAGLPHVRAV